MIGRPLSLECGWRGHLMAASWLTTENATGDQVEVRIVALDKRDVRVMMERDSYVAPLAWSHNSDRLLVLIEQGSTDEIVWVFLATGATQLVKRLPGRSLGRSNGGQDAERDRKASPS
jgi:hypothetical protein